MASIARWLKRIVLVVIVILAGASAYLYIFPPELLRVGAGYASKIVCSNLFIAGRDAATVLSKDVQAPGNPLLKLFNVEADEGRGVVSASFLGFIAQRSSVYRPGYGCTVLDGGPEGIATLPELPKLEAMKALDGSLAWPEGEGIGDAPNADVAALIADSKLNGPEMRAVVVVQHGRIIAETYGEGFDANTPLIGWSMTKTVNAALLGLAVGKGVLSLDDKGLFPVWADDERRDISVSSLAAMQSGLRFNEDYGDVSDVTRMLYLESDMAHFVISQSLETPVDSVFHYATGTSVALSRYWQDKVGADSLVFPRQALFEPLGMTSAVLETDAAGTFAGGSYLYATAHDWARFGELLLRDGIWGGRRILPEGFVELMRTPSQPSGGDYSMMQSWFAGPGEEPGSRFGLPPETFWLKGHDGQSVAIVPSADLVMVRMGLTPSRLRYRPQVLLKKVLDAL